MGIVRGIRAINQKLDESSSTSGGTTKVRWLQIKDGQTVRLRFINEIDADSPNYDEVRGVVAMVPEHVNPKDYKRKGVCTMDDEGRCYGCEMRKVDPKWRSKDRFYTNVLVDNGIDEPYVAVWSMGTYKSPTYTTISDYSDDVDSISNMVWKLKRTGEGTEATYSLIPGPVDTEPFKWGDITPFPIESAIRQVPYAEQEKFYLGFNSGTSSAPSDDTW